LHFAPTIMNILSCASCQKHILLTSPPLATRSYPVEPPKCDLNCLDTQDLTPHLVRSFSVSLAARPPLDNKG
jgi:hypothetical protein